MKFIALLPWADWLALVCFVGLWAGYAWFAKAWGAKAPSLLSTTNRYRGFWMLQATARDPRMLDGLIAQSLSQTPSFFCSTSILIIGGLFAVLGTTEKAADQKEIATLRGQLQGIQEQVARFQQESEDYRQQIVTLTERLDATNLRLAETGQGAVSEVEAGLENKVLREIILQQMKQQAKRETARKNIMDDLAREGVLESMKNLGIETERIYRSLGEMAASPTMTKEQRGVLSNSRLDQFLLKNGVGDLMMVQDSQALKDQAAADPTAPTGEARTKEQLSPELKAYANAAEEQFRRGAFNEAESQYRKILLIEPMNVHALSNLGVVQVNRGDFPEAEKTIRKALAYDYDSGPAHYLLGVIYLRQKQLDEAVEELGVCLKLDPANANAHLTLGLIAAQRKQRSEAEQQFKQAIAIDSASAYAHFNLAVLYATDEKLTLARQHYRLGIQHGASRDGQMDKLLGD